MQLPESEQIEGIKAGSLWPYIKEARLYKCPTGYRGEMLTYAMMTSISGRVVEGSPVFKKMSDIRQPSKQLFFIDEGWGSSWGYSVKYKQPKWWDQPVTRHGDGTNFCFADGHSEYHKWEALETIKEGRKHERTWGGGLFAPKTKEGLEGLQWVQRGEWGEIGYSLDVVR